MSIGMEEVEDIRLHTRNAGETAVEWVLSLSNGTDVPFLRYINQLAAAIYDAYQAQKKLNHRIGKIIREIKETNATLAELMANNQQTDDSLFHPLSAPLKRYSNLLLRLKKECERWKEKGRLQRMLSARDQHRELSQLEMEIANVRQNTILAAIAQFENQKRAHEARVLVFMETMRNFHTLHFNPQQVPPSFDLPSAPPLIGRKDELQAIREHLRIPGSIVSLVGGAGYGKSACASTFIRSWVHEDTSNRFGIWIAAETEDSLRNAYLRMCEAYSIERDESKEASKEATTSQLAQLVWKKLTSVQRFQWIVVFDNVPEADGNMTGPQALIPSFFPGPLTPMGNGSILFTTRSTQYIGEVGGIGRIRCVQIRTLPMKDAVEMVLANTYRNEERMEEDRASAEMLVGKDYFDCLAIAIITACGYINMVRGMTIKKYVDEMNTGDGANAVRKAMEKTLILAREEFGLGELLDTVAFVKPDDVPLLLLGGEEKRAAVAHLQDLNILRRRGEDRWSIHRLHQEAARQGRAPTAALASVSSQFRQTTWRTDHSRWKYLAEVVVHADVLCRHHENIMTSQQDKQNDPTREDDPKTAFYILFDSGAVKYRVLSDFEGALSSYTMAVSLLRHVHGADAKNADLAKTLDCIGTVYERLGRYDDALSKYNEALGMERRLYGANTRSVLMASTLDNIGDVYKCLGRYNDALGKLNEALRLKHRVYGADAKNTDLATTLNNIGNVYDRLGRYDDALAKFYEALSMQHHVYGAKSKNVNLASALNNIGNVYKNLGRYEDALTKYNEALSMKRHLFGTDAKNPDLASTLNNIGLVYTSLGRYNEALETYQEALSMNHDVYGTDAKNELLASNLNNVGLVYKSLGRYDDALEKYEEALSMERHVYGPDAKNADLAGTLNNIGLVNESLGRYDDALAKFDEALSMKRHVYGVNAKNADLAGSLNNIGNVCESLGRYDAALAKYEEAHLMYRHVYGADAKNIDLASTLHNTGNVCQRLERYDDALAKYNEALSMKRHVYGTDAKNADLAGSLINIGVVYESLGRCDDALAKFEEALSMQRHVYGADAKNANLAGTLNNIGVVNVKLGHHDDALAKYNEALSMKRHVYGNDAKNADLATTLNNIGVIYRYLGRFDEALTKFTEALAMKRHVYGANAKNASLLSTLNNIGLVYESLGRSDDARANFEEVLSMYRHVNGANTENADLPRPHDESEEWNYPCAPWFLTCCAQENKK